MSNAIIPIDTSSISSTNMSESYWDTQCRLAMEKKFGDIVGYVLGAAVGFFITGLSFYTVYHLWKKEPVIGLIILIFVIALIMCGMAIRFLVMTIQVLIEKWHHQYHLPEPIKYNSLSRSANNKWWSSNRYIHKLKMMSGVSIQENHQLNI
ncbi:unnamed protein product [Rotaria socialis]